MNQFYFGLVLAEERSRVESLEPFDEHEVSNCYAANVYIKTDVVCSIIDHIYELIKDQNAMVFFSTHPQEWHLKCSHYFILTASRGSLMTQALLQNVPGQLLHYNCFILCYFDGQDNKKVIICFTLKI